MGAAVAVSAVLMAATFPALAQATAGPAAQTRGAPAAGQPGAATAQQGASQPPAATALMRRMLEAERTLEVTGTTRERIDLPGVRPDPSHSRFTLPVAVTPELLTHAFTLHAEAGADVAGRKVAVLHLDGKDPLTPDWTFWVDARSGVRLGYRVTDSVGAVVAEGRYTQVRAVTARRSPRTLPSPTAGAVALDRLIDPAAVPSGYVPVGLKRAEIGARGVPALRLTFWDGLDALVVVIYRRQAKLPAAAGAHMVSRNVGRFTVSVVGPAPHAALEAWLARLARGPLARLDPARALGSVPGP